MELREWLIILGLALVTLIVIDGLRRLHRQRRIPRLDQVPTNGGDAEFDPEAAAREAEINWELPNGGARVLKPADYSALQSKPKLERQEHPGPSRVLAGLKAARDDEASAAQRTTASEAVASRTTTSPSMADDSNASGAETSETGTAAGRSEPEDGAKAADAQSPAIEPSGKDSEPAESRQEPSLSALADEPAPARAVEPLAADPAEHDEHQDERYRLVDLEGVGDSLKAGSKRMGATMQRSFNSLQKSLADRREQGRLEKARRNQARAQKAEEAAKVGVRDDDPLFAPGRSRSSEAAPEPAAIPAAEASPSVKDEGRTRDVVRPHPVLEKALRHDVSADHARHTLSHADEIIVISVMARDETGFSGTVLLDLMLACGLRYSRDMGIFHRFETEDPASSLQFSMVNVLKPGTFPIEAMDDFHTPGVTLLMPLPGATDTTAAFEAMVETAMVLVRHLGGELKDENQSVMTAQTVEFARQRVQEFERRNRLHRYQAN